MSVFTAPRHPQSNRLAENFVRSLKITIEAQAPQTLPQLWKAIDSFLLQYRNAVHVTTGKTPSYLLHGRNSRTTANIDTTDVVFCRGNNNRPCRGILINKIGNRMFQVVDQADGSVDRRHIDQVNVNLPTHASRCDTSTFT